MRDCAYTFLMSTITSLSPINDSERLNINIPIIAIDSYLKMSINLKKFILTKRQSESSISFLLVKNHPILLLSPFHCDVRCHHVILQFLLDLRYRTTRLLLNDARQRDCETCKHATETNHNRQILSVYVLDFYKTFAVIRRGMYNISGACGG